MTTTQHLCGLAVLCAALVAPPVVAQEYFVGFQDDDGSTYLFNEPVDGVYGNAWWGTFTGLDDEGRLNIALHGEGKTASFDGQLLLSCDGSAESFWLAPEAVEGEPPAGAIDGAWQVFCSQAPTSASGYGGFSAYVSGLAANEILSIRADHTASADKIGSLPGNAEGVVVNWCDTFDGQTWCDISYADTRGWIAETEYLRNVESD